MKNAIIASVVLHLTVMLLLYFEFSNAFRLPNEEVQHLIIDFQAVGPKSQAPRLAPTNVKKEDTLQKKESEKPTETTPPPEEVKDTTPPAPPAEDAKAQEAKTVDTPTPEVVDSKLETVNLDQQKKKEDKKKKDKKEKEANKETKVNPKDKKSANKSDKKEKDAKSKKKKKDDAKLVDLKKPKKTNKKKTIDQKAKSAEKKLDSLMDNLAEEDGDSEAGAPAESVGDTLTATEVQAVVATIAKCWFVPAGTQGVLDTSVDVTLHMREDGTVQKAEIEDKKRFATDPVFRTAAESVQRAALDPNCNPLPLPKQHYKSWKVLEFNFNPRAMAGISGGVVR